MDKTRARDEDGKIQKAPQPDPTEMIDPFLYQYMGRAVNYDRRWVGTMRLGGTLGCWCTTPFSRPNMGDEASELYDKLKSEGKISWDEKGFFFTHAQGVAARKHYEKQALEGKLKANGKSWKNKHAGFTGVSFEELEKRFPEIYKKSTASAYVSKADKLERIAAMRDFFDENEIEQTYANLSKALIDHEQKWATMDALKKLIEEAEKPDTTDETEVIEAEPEFNFDQMEPSDEEILSESAPELDIDEDELATAASEVSEEDKPMNLHEQLIATKGPLETEEEDEEQVAEPETTSTAASTATEPAFDFDVAESEVTEVKELPDEPITARVFQDSSKEKIHTDKESVGWKDTEGTQRQAFLVEVPEYREMWLEQGMNLVGDADTGRLWLIEVLISE